MVFFIIALMQLQLNNVLPVYFEEGRKNQSEIWGKNLTFAKGEYVKIVAPSGSGKTSLMHFLYGMRKDFSGSITYENKKINQLSAEELAVQRSKQTSIVFQDLQLFPEQTLSEIISDTTL